MFLRLLHLKSSKLLAVLGVGSAVTLAVAALTGVVLAAYGGSPSSSWGAGLAEKIRAVTYGTAAASSPALRSGRAAFWPDTAQGALWTVLPSQGGAFFALPFSSDKEPVLLSLPSPANYKGAPGGGGAPGVGGGSGGGKKKTAAFADEAPEDARQEQPATTATPLPGSIWLLAAAGLGLASISGSSRRKA